jgi:diguanylate cyclase (GGDEF)-like protein
VSRESDFVCRYGGDEFAVILPETTREGALIYAERIKKSVENLEIYPEGPEGGSDGRPISVSIGVIQFPSEGIDLDNLVKCADLALMDAKKDKNRIVSYHESRLRNDAGESRSPAGTSSD